MKQIGIITFHASHNYGSVLQAYALENIIIELINCNCEIINFAIPQQSEMYSLFNKNNTLKNICKNILTILYKYKVRKSRIDSFNKFINYVLRLSDKKYISISQLEQDKLKYDTIICGSDQIWNIDIKDFDYSYFLPFIKNVKKIAYAPSFGGDNPIRDVKTKSVITNYLKDFYALSVRENKGKKILKQLTSKEINVVLDPTLLLTSKDWDTICSDRIINKDYIFFYSIDYNKDVVTMVKKISIKLNLPVIILFTMTSTFKTIFSGFEVAKQESPSDFISLIKYARLVLSNSFHGNVFSIIYRKPFYILRGTYNGKINTDNRLTTLLKKFNINNREININIIDSFNISLNMDYSDSEQYIEKERKKSIEYLLNSINGDYKNDM
ncbi:polysaccharide pyruvyl transferase family protein [Clostridium tyrobutyricum]|uniref:polysaccharide pyruvyl transferase family protein n=1 Tax=Clostridium tyrobutyricum TaxID=1519 RepID=UPI0030D39159